MKNAFKRIDQREMAGHFPDHGSKNSQPWSTGMREIDACLPDHGLNRAGLHEIEPLKPTDMPSLTGFCFALLSRLQSTKPIIWCVTAEQVGDYGHLYAFGLDRYSISPARIIFTKVNHPLHLHFALEEALKTEGVAAVIGEGPRPNFTGSRRLSMLCKTHNRPCLLMSGQPGDALGSAALTRWQVMPTQGVEDQRDPFGPGLPTWKVALPRARSGRTMPRMEEEADKHAQNSKNSSYPWRVFWDDQTLCFRSAALSSNRAVQEGLAAECPTPKTMVG